MSNVVRRGSCSLDSRPSPRSELRGSSLRQIVQTKRIKLPFLPRLEYGHVLRLGSFVHHRGPVRVEGLRQLEAPSLTLRALGLGPGDRLVVGGEDQVPSGEDLDAVAAGLVDVEEEALGYGMFGRAGLYIYPFLQEDISSAQHFFPGVGPVGDVVQATRSLGGIHRIRNIVDQRGNAD